MTNVCAWLSQLQDLLLNLRNAKNFRLFWRQILFVFVFITLINQIDGLRLLLLQGLLFIFRTIPRLKFRFELFFADYLFFQPLIFENLFDLLNSFSLLSWNRLLLVKSGLLSSKIYLVFCLRYNFSASDRCFICRNFLQSFFLRALSGLRDFDLGLRLFHHLLHAYTYRIRPWLTFAFLLLRSLSCYFLRNLNTFIRLTDTLQHSNFSSPPWILIFNRCMSHLFCCNILNTLLNFRVLRYNINLLLSLIWVLQNRELGYLSWLGLQIYVSCSANNRKFRLSNFNEVIAQFTSNVCRQLLSIYLDLRQNKIFRAFTFFFILLGILVQLSYIVI